MSGALFDEPVCCSVQQSFPQPYTSMSVCPLHVVLLQDWRASRPAILWTITGIRVCLPQSGFFNIIIIIIVVFLCIKKNKEEVQQFLSYILFFLIVKYSVSLPLLQYVVLVTVLGFSDKFRGSLECLINEIYIFINMFKQTFRLRLLNPGAQAIFSKLDFVTVDFIVKIKNNQSSSLKYPYLK